VVDLFAVQAPEACRYFSQLCVDGKLNKAKFHRIVPKTLIQAKANTADDAPVLKAEFNSRAFFYL
jgi:cyclophilin family peptidyl-prolyl cis-trans isomerase